MSNLPWSRAGNVTSSEFTVAPAARLGDDACSSRFMPAKSKRVKGKKLSASAAKLRLLKSLKCTLRYEKKAWESGACLVAGVDEVGRGSLFGPVVAAAVILDRDYRIRGLRDSKLIL